MPQYYTDNVRNQVAIAGVSAYDDLPRLVNVNRANRGMLTLSPILSATLAGKQFFYSEAFTLAETTDQKDYVLVTPNTTKWCHLTYHAEGQAITEISLWEDTKFTSTDSLTVYNNDRNSTDANTTLLYQLTTPTSSTDTGSRLIHHKSGSATQQSRDDASVEVGDEMILKQNSRYRLNIVTESTGNLCNVFLHWHEHTNES